MRIQLHAHLLATTALVCLAACSNSTDKAASKMNAPQVQARPYQVPSPNGAREDEYYWLRDDTRKNPEMLAYLNQENAYADAALAHTKPLKDKLFREFTGRIQQDDSTAPYMHNGYWYYTRYATGQEYPIYARKAKSLDAAEEVLLDVNVLAKGHDYFQVGHREISPDNQMLAWTEDTVGRREYVLKVMDLKTRQVLPDVRTGIESEVVWHGDNRTLLYIEKHPETLLGFRVRRHTLGDKSQAVATDLIVWEQKDDSFYTEVSRTKDDRFLLINSSSTVSSEVWYADAADKELRFKLFLPAERDHEYQIERAGDRWIVLTNWQAKNFRIVSVAATDTADRAKWRDVVAHRDDALIDSFDVFKDFLAIEEHSGGLRKLRIHPWAGGADIMVTADEPSYTMTLGANRDYSSNRLRYVYTSLVTPPTTYDFEPKTGKRDLLKQQAVLGGYDATGYRTEFEWATARDGVKVPVTIVYRKDVKLDGSAPLLQMGYGSYGISNDPSFAYQSASLLDRGFVLVIAHIRGGQEMGRAWYENGKLLNKHNTFNDFIDVTRWLVANKYADPKRVFALGRSAGGLLMGAIANMAPQDYRGIVSGVPFVDVVTTMLDESIPLTTNEFDEWGNPKQKPYYDYMLSYSPYDNIGAHDYPAMFVFSGLWDSQVQYYEPTKYVARLRARRTGNSLIVLRTNMEAGHGGKSGRFDRYHEYAEQYAFILDQAGVTQ
jgi:oligopeptidase B